MGSLTTSLTSENAQKCKMVFTSIFLKVVTSLDWNYCLCASHHSMETCANRNCTMLKLRQYPFYFVRNGKENAATYSDGTSTTCFLICAQLRSTLRLPLTVSSICLSCPQGCLSVRLFLLCRPPP